MTGLEPRDLEPYTQPDPNPNGELNDGITEPGIDQPDVEQGEGDPTPFSDPDADSPDYEESAADRVRHFNEDGPYQGADPSWRAAAFFTRPA